MASHGHLKTPSTSTEEHTSSSSSTESNSTPNTPPSPTVQPHTPPQRIARVPPQPNRRTPTAVGKSPQSTSKSRLGAINEDSDEVSPDIPVRHPRRRLALPQMKFAFPMIPTLHAKRDPPKNIYDDVQGPNGEKFSDVRSNKKLRSKYCGGWRALVCVGCLLFIIGAAVAIGVIVGFKVRDNRRNSANAASNATNSGLDAGFPAGQYSITTYLENVNTSCTTPAATWSCYPYSTYQESASASLSTLNWIITGQNGTNYTITSADQVFSYSFQNVPLKLANNGTEEENWTFNTLFNKVVIPSVPITSDGTTAKCFFNGTMLTGRLYTKKQKAAALNTTTTNSTSGGSSNAFQPWPYALRFEESHGNGDGVPDCYEYTNGQLGRSLPTNYTYTNAGVVLNCGCTYADYH